MSKQNTPENANRQQRRIIRGSPPTPDETFDLRNTPSATQEPQRINFAPPQFVYPNQPYYNQAYNNPPFAPPQQQNAFNPHGQQNMYGHYNYGSHHNVGGSSSQPNVGGFSSPIRDASPGHTEEAGPKTLLKIKKQELELKAAELEIRRMENRQRDEALYETTTDGTLKERLRQRLFG
uniref:Uncharacterized protein n=1 Tax=Tanacetum cinerariifolium TaxID=118510 RepID=A0A699IAJ7_TANCI|nr:hypothetical protein [Tanacetum cinerariifolium]